MEPILKESFPHFLVYTWRFLGLPDPTPVQLDMAKFMQHGGRRIGIQAFRGVGKSWICSAYVTWLLLRDPDVKVLVVSASKDRSDAFSTFTKRLIWELPLLQFLKPDKAKGDRLSNVAFDVRPARPAHAPSVKAVGITGQMTGSRADYIVVDDCEVPNNSETALMREKLLQRVAELGGAILTPQAQAGEAGGMIFLGTPQVEDTLYSKLPEMGYDFRIWPAQVPEVPENYRGRLAPMIDAMIADGAPAGTPVDPKRFDRDELEERLREYRSAGFALQFQLDTSLVDADLHPLKMSDLIVAPTGVDVCPDKFEWSQSDEYEIAWAPLVGLPGDKFYGPMFTADDHSPYDGAMMFIDPSGRGKDETAYAVVKMLHGFLVVRRWGGDPGGYQADALARLATVARDEKVKVIVIEDNFGDGMFTELIKPVLNRVYPDGCGVEEVKVHSQKELRICDALEPVMAMHKLVMDEEVVRHNTRPKTHAEDVLKSAFFQLSRMTREKGALKFDDRIDALAGAVAWWTDRMAQDTDKKIKNRDDSRLQKELDDFALGILSPQGRKAALNKNRSGNWGGIER